LAPFLAVAMYYLLQVLAEKVTQPVLVVMAFATGLVSKAVIGGIINFAESRLPGGKEPQDPEAAKKAADEKARQADADAARRALDAAKARQVRFAYRRTPATETRNVSRKDAKAAKVGEKW
jgi:hypothetical protein